MKDVNMPPNLELESKHKGKIIVGIDEVGRGSLAGPVIACALILDLNNIALGIKDSKKLSASKRQQIYLHLTKYCQFAIGSASVEEIEQYNILGATKLAMQRAYHYLPNKADLALIDGNQLPELPCPMIAVIDGDNISLSIAAASIVAKVTRDMLMVKLAGEHPYYGWERNAGYGTGFHLKSLQEFGVSIHHRPSFAPVRNIISNNIIYKHK